MDQVGAETTAACLGLYEQQPQLGLGLRVFDQEDRADNPTLRFSKPTLFSLGIVVLYKGSDNAGNQGLKLLVPTEFTGIKHPVPVNNPAHVPWPYIVTNRHCTM
jgi:hypothetical protein